MGYAFRRPCRDANHAVVVAALERVGCFVIDLSSVGGGVPDLLVARHGVLRLMEIKNPDGRTARRAKSEIANGELLNDEQIAFLARYGDSGPPIHVTASVREALAVVCRDEAEIEAALVAAPPAREVT